MGDCEEEQGEPARKKGECSAHFICAVVLENLREVIAFTRADTEGFTRQAMSNRMETQMKEQAQAKRTLEQQERRITAVSYTHLDVYKRQGLHRQGHFQYDRGDGERSAARPRAKPGETEVGDMKSMYYSEPQTELLSLLKTLGGMWKR